VHHVDILSGNGADVVITRDEQLLFDEVFYVTGSAGFVAQLTIGDRAMTIGWP
jgi:7,8-dihydropterin-6-yl-methyl-4-(beta-D-ribofuranosyl)aminobenzene 5'-phosphate synthase